MKDFLKDHLVFILFFYSQSILIVILVQLASYIEGSLIEANVIVYLFILTTVFLIVFLIYRYRKLRDYYLLEPNSDPEQLPEAPNRLLERINTHYMMRHNDFVDAIEQLTNAKQMEFHFIQQWVHQMKTPISVLHLILQKEKFSLPEELRQSMQEEIERLQQGLDLALYQSRLQKFDRDFHVQRVGLQQIVKESVQEFKSSFIRNGVYPSVEINDELIVATDPKWFRFVLNQIISNAIKYSKADSEKITIIASRQGRLLKLKITDTGHGIPSQDLSRIFDPFFTGLNGRTFRESTGMGLYLSKEICDELGHGLLVESEQGKGTTVTITFENPIL